MKYVSLFFSISILFVTSIAGFSQPVNEEEPLAQYSETPEYEEQEIEFVDNNNKGAFNSQVAERYLTTVNPGFAGLSSESNQPLSANSENLKSSPGAEELPYSVLSVGDYNNKGNGGKAFLKAVGVVGAIALEYADDQHCAVD